jgi:very-short-patch-repair endonuclease
MILEQETFDKFGYHPKDLSYGSKKMVVVNCDYCKKDFDKARKYLNKADDLVQKDCCFGCRNKKAEDVNIVKYGHANQFSRQEIRDKIGPEHKIRTNTQEFKDKIKKTCMEKYGVASPLQDPKVREKIENTMLKKYGVKNASQAKEIQEKKMATNLERYGNEHYLASDEGRKASIEGVIKKYGVNNVFQSEEIKKKIKLTNLAKYGFDHYLKNKESATENAKKSLQTRIDKGDINLYDGHPMSYYSKDSEYSKGRFITLVNTYGMEIALSMTPKVSSLEQVCAVWLDEMNLEYHKNKIENRKPDFVLEKYKLVIELDSLYYHSSEMQPDDLYHVKKMDFYKERGYNSLFFRENEIISNQNIVKKLIKQNISQNSVLDVRNYKIDKFDTKYIQEIMDKFHLISSDLNAESLILSIDNLPVATIQYNIFDGVCEIFNFCCSNTYTLKSAFGAFLQYFENNSPNIKVRFTSDRRFGPCDYVGYYGFSLESCDPDYVWTDSNVVFKRLEVDNNIVESKFFKLWDCGQAKYIKTR